MVFIDILVGWLGFVYDFRVLCNFVVYNIVVNKFRGNIYLLGDGGYFLQIWFMILYRDNGYFIVDEIFFNYVLLFNRQIVERVIRFFKGRWRKLQYIDYFNLKLIVFIIIVVCVFYNVCFVYDDFDEGYMFDNENEIDDSSNDNGVVK